MTTANLHHETVALWKRATRKAKTACLSSRSPTVLVKGKSTVSLQTQISILDVFENWVSSFEARVSTFENRVLRIKYRETRKLFRATQREISRKMKAPKWKLLEERTIGLSKSIDPSLHLWAQILCYFILILFVWYNINLYQFIRFENSQ